MKKSIFALSLCLISILATAKISAQTIVISQFYGGAGTASATYNRDYVELFNASSTPQSLNGLAIQYGSSTGNFGSTSSLIYPIQNVTLQPGQYYLVGLATGAGINNLPVAIDNTTANSINMSGTQGKVALTNTTTALGCGATATPCALPHPNIVDLAAWGGSNNAEGGASVNNGVNITAQQGGVRKSNGCQDTNNNNADFDVASPPIPRNTFSTFNSCFGSPDIDLTISRSADPTVVELNDEVTFTINVANGGTDSASNVRATFVVPNGLTFSNATVNGGFTASESGGTVTFDNGTVGGGGSVELTVVATATTQGFKAISATADVTVDPNNTITETNEANNNAADAAEIRIFFPSTVTGLFGRASLAQLMADIDDIGGAQTVVLDSDLVNENSTINVPDFLRVDFRSFVVSGTGQIVFGNFCGILTSHPNGIGDSTNLGNIQLTGMNNFGTSTDFTYYAPLFTFTENQGVLLPQNAYGMPSTIGSFRINNPSGVNIFAPFFVGGDFFLTNGNVYNGSNTISLSEFSRINGDNNGEGSETSFVVGKLQKFIPDFSQLDSTNGFASNFVFPIGTVGGTDNGYSPLKAINYFANASNSSLTVEAIDAPLPGVTTPSISRYWQITETGDVTTNLRFNWRFGEDSAIGDPSEVRIFRGTSNACEMNLSNCSIMLSENTATITGVSDFSPWGLAQLGPNAAGVSIGGKIINSQGVGLRNIEVTLTDSNGNIRRINTGTFGYFLFEDLEAGNTYVLSFNSKNYHFLPRVVTPSEDILDLEIIPQQ